MKIKEETNFLGLVVQVHWRHSLATKMFLLMFVGLSFIVATLTVQNTRWFKSFLDQQFEQGTKRQVEEAVTSIEASIEKWVTIASMAMHNAPGFTKAKFGSYLQRLNQSSREFVAFQVVRSGSKVESVASSFTENTGDVRFRSMQAKTIKKQLLEMNLKYIGQIKEDSSAEIRLIPLMNQLELPLLTIMVRFQVVGKSYSDWMALTVWADSLLTFLENNEVVKSFIVDSKGTVVFSPDSDFLKNGAQAMDLKNVPAPTRSVRYKNHTVGNTGYYVANRLIGESGLAVYVARDVGPASRIVEAIVRRSASWAVFFLVLMAGISWFVATQVTRKLKLATAATGKIASGDFTVTLQDQGRDEVGLLSRAVSSMAVQIQHLLHAQVEAARQEKELETARIVQATMFPKDDIHSEMLHVYGHCQAASECGGDWWGYFKMESGKEFVFIADATGHGAPAALVTAMAYAGHRTIFELLQSGDEQLTNPADLLRTMNNIFWEAGRGTTTLTCFVAMIDPDNGTMCYANAGHNIPALIPHATDDDRLKTRRKKVQRHLNLTSTGNPLGLMAEVTYEQHSVELRPSDKIVMYTDGIIECQNPEGDVWGMRIFKKKLEEYAEQSGGDVKNNLLTSAFDFFNGHPADDDVTVVVVEVDKDWSTKNVQNVA